MIAREAPGLGDPWDLTPAVWDVTLERIGEQLALESGDEEAQGRVRLERMKRRKQREQAWQRLSAKQM